MEIALAHDSFTQLGGAEKIIESFHELYPDAEVYTLVFDGKFAPRYSGWKIQTSLLQVFYGMHPKLQHWLFFIPMAVARLKIKPADVVLSSSSGFIKALFKPKGSVHIDYCHTPTRFLWTNSDYLEQEVPAILRPPVRSFLKKMKVWDLAAAKRVDFFIANSAEVQRRIKEIYNRDSTIIYPGVDINFWHPTWQKQSYFLIAGRLQAHKKNDLMVEIFNDLKIPLHVVGTGRHEEYLKSIAKPNITFFGRLSDEVLRDQYSGAKGFIFPQEEDFGLMPLEAAACGTATLAYGKGGALETIVPGVTGELFGTANVVQAPGLPNEQGTALHYNKDEIKQFVINWDEKKYSADILRAQAEKFSKEKFKKEISEFVSKHTGNL